MRLFRAWFGRKTNGPKPAFTLAHTRGFKQQIVGEASYQKAIGKVVGAKKEHSAKFECQAVLHCDNDNQYDSNAVAVVIGDGLVGYLPRAEANKYREELAAIDPSLPDVGVRAIIVGGWHDSDSEAHFGVKLNIKRPLQKI